MNTIHINHHGHTHDITIDTDTPIGHEIAKLQYFNNHNNSHIKELEKIYEFFKEQNYEESANLIRKSIELMEECSHNLIHAIEHASEG